MPALPKASAMPMHMIVQSSAEPAHCSPSLIGFPSLSDRWFSVTEAGGRHDRQRRAPRPSPGGSTETMAHSRFRTAVPASFKSEVSLSAWREFPRHCHQFPKLAHFGPRLTLADAHRAAVLLSHSATRRS